MWRALLLAVTMLSAVVTVASQTEVPRAPLPPDLIHVHNVGCHIAAHRSGQVVVDAKTGDVADGVLWSVTPFAVYNDLPDGTKREEWHPATKEGADKWIFSVPGTSDYLPREATDACSAWMKMANHAIVAERHSEGHK